VKEQLKEIGNILKKEQKSLIILTNISGVYGEEIREPRRWFHYQDETDFKPFSDYCLSFVGSNRGNFQLEFQAFAEDSMERLAIFNNEDD